MKTYKLPSTAVALILLALPLVSGAVSMGEVLGRVVENESKKPVAYAQVILENNMDRIAVTANEYGYYYASHVPTGRYQIRVVYNNHTFVVNRVKVYDNYSSQVDIKVSNNNQLPETVEVIRKEEIINPMEAHNIDITSSTSSSQASISLTEALIMQPGVDVRDGKIFIKGSSQVRFFVDGSPVLAPPVLARW